MASLVLARERGVYDVEQLIDFKGFRNAVERASAQHMLDYFIISMATHHDHWHIGSEWRI